jgi:transposase
MLRIRLSEEQRDQLRRRLADRKLSLEDHTRLRILHLSDQHLSPPQIAQTLGWHPNSVRKWLKRFQSLGLEGLLPRKAPGRQPHLSEPEWQQVEAWLDASLQTGQRTFSTTQIGAWIKERFGRSFNRVYLTQKLKSRGWRYKRTKRTLEHNQPDPTLVAAASLKLAALKKAGPGWVR